MYVSWDRVNAFKVFPARPERYDVFGYKDTPEPTEWTWYHRLQMGESAKDLPGFPTPAHPTLWEVTADGVTVVERVE